MIRTRFHSVLRERIELQIQKEALAVAQGHLTDHAAYKYQCGLIHGLQAALDIGDLIEGEFDGGRSQSSGETDS